MEEAFAELQEVLKESEDGIAMYEKLQKLQPGDEDYDSILDHYKDEDDPDKSTRAELEQTVTSLCQFFLF